MTLAECQKKHGAKYTVKDQGYWDKDETQLIFKSELLDKKGIPTKKGLIFLINGEDRMLPQGLQNDLVKYLKDEGELPKNVKYFDERFKIPVYLLPVFSSPVTAVLEEILKPQPPIPVEEKIAFPITKPLETSIIPEALQLVSDVLISKPSLVKDLEFISELSGGTLRDYLAKSVNAYIVALEDGELSDKELSNLIINLILLNKSK